MIHESAARTRRREAVHQEILAAATEIVADGGIAALKMDRLAKALGYVPAALYRYFPSKDALVAELIGAALDDLWTTLAPTLGSEAGSPIDAILGGVEAYLAFGRDRPETLQLIHQAVGDPRILMESDREALLVFAKAMPIFAALAARLEAAMAKGALEAREPMLAALELWAGLQGALQLAKLVRFAPEPPDIEALARRQVRTILRGFGLDPAELAQGTDSAHQTTKTRTKKRRSSP